MTYPLLEQAPKDHKSEEFLQFLRDNNEVVDESAEWLIIKNVKYHSKDRLWYTAFLKHNYIQNVDFSYLDFAYGHLNWLKKASGDQSVKRFHVHMYE